MESVNNILNGFAPISLKEMDSVKLMNRTDTKYVMSLDQFSDLLIQLQDKYRILEIKGNRLSSYKSLYFDTDDFLLYTRHQNGKLNRHKIRYRKYLESDLTFLEVKFKSNKGRTIKKRIKTNDIPNNFNNKELEFIEKLVPLKPEDLKPSLWVYFSRLTLVHKTDKERLTFDLNISFKDKFDLNEFNLPNMAIAELKQEKFTSNSDFIKVAQKNRIRPMRISKYCIGASLLYDNLKYNRFKRKLLTINKLHYDVNADQSIWKRARAV